MNEDRGIGILRRSHSLVLLALAGAAAAQPGVPAPPGLDREKVWPAPTAEDWKRPVQIKFQRTWEDAVVLSRETRKPILICINMDGEIASEHWAGVRYRLPEMAALTAPYVCVVASVYRHNPRDYDEQGRRILCPRFGSVTCGEHIAIEPILHEKFMDGKRIAPRHIMVELDGSETYDVYYTWDTESVSKAIHDGIANRLNAAPLVRGDRTLLERVASPDDGDKAAVEKAYLAGDQKQRYELLDAALAMGASAPVDLLRLAVYGLDVDLAKMARQALAQSSSLGAVDLINDALRVPMAASERDALVAALVRLGQSSPKARMLAVAHQALGSSSTAVDVEQWSKAVAGAEYPAPSDRLAIESRLDSLSSASRAHPDDAAAHVALAEATLALALDPKEVQALSADPRTARQYAYLRFQDARRAALEAEKLGASGWRLDAVVALAAYNLGDKKEAYARAEAAMRGMPVEPTDRNAVGVLAIFAEARQAAIVEAVRAKKPWPPQWLTDVHAAYSALAAHPLCTDQQVVSHYDFLKFFGAATQAAHVLEQGLSRFPDSWLLHDRLRARILEEKGPAGLEPAYERMLAKPDASKSLAWFAGYTSLVAAEYFRRARDGEQALAAYERAMDHFEGYIAEHPQSRATADHYVAMALAGRARLALEHKEWDRATADVLASFTREPQAAATLDGLNVSPVDTAKMLRARVRDAKRDDLVAALDAALANLDPKLLELPAYEREVPAQRPRRRR